MNLQEFYEKMNKDKYNPNFIFKEDGNTYMWNYFTDSIHDVTEYKNDDLTMTYGSLERHINKKVELINFIRDRRLDCFDDGGYCFYVGKYQNKFILGSNYVSYNLEFSEDFIDKPILEKEDEDVEYKFFDSLEDIQSYIELIVKEAESYTADDPEWGYESWDLEEEDYQDLFLHKCMRNLGAAYCEQSEANKQDLLNLTKESYTPLLLDPVEYYDGWIDEHEEE